MRSRRLEGAILAAACLLAGTSLGCATTSKSKGEQEAEFICSDEPMTGSHISRMRCTSKRSAEERRESDRATMEKLQFDTARPRQVGGSPSPGPGPRPLLLPGGGGATASRGGPVSH